MLGPMGGEHGFSSTKLPLYFEWHGKPSGSPAPLLLIHGGGSTIASNWAPLIRALESSRRLLAVELQGHGRTGPGEQSATFVADEPGHGAGEAHAQRLHRLVRQPGRLDHRT